MKALFRLLSQLKAFFSKRFRRSYQIRIVDGDLPAQIRRRIVYIVQEDGYLEHISMLCPCRCNQVLHMNLMPDERPCWQITKNPNQTISLHPSIWRKKGCNSHFWFRENRVYWC
jgi:Family of unknown function (DUF6527)